MSKSNIGYSLTLHLLLIIALGFALLIISTIGIPYVLDQEALKSSPYWTKLLDSANNVIEPFSYTLMGIGCFVFPLKKITKVAWDSSAKFAIGEIHNTVKENLDTVTKTVVSSSGDINGFIKGLNRPVTIGECKNRDEFNSVIHKANREMYGAQISNERSIYHFINHNLIEPFACTPHPSKVNRRISIKPHNEFFNKWVEEVEEEIHHVKYGITKSDAHFDFVYRTSTYAPDMTLDDWLDSQNLVIKIDGKKIDEHLNVGVENETDPGVYCWSKDDWIYYRCEIRVTLVKEWTPISIKETCLTEINDNSYTLSTGKPICGYRLRIQLPDGYSITKNPFISSKVAQKGLPQFRTSALKEDQIVTVDRYEENDIDIKINDWLLPGIIASIYWNVPVRETAGN
jgi:hypothetical protein